MSDYRGLVKEFLISYLACTSHCLDFWMAYRIIQNWFPSGRIIDIELQNVRLPESFKWWTNEGYALLGRVVVGRATNARGDGHHFQGCVAQSAGSHIGSKGTDVCGVWKRVRRPDWSQKKWKLNGCRSSRGQAGILLCHLTELKNLHPPFLVCNFDLTVRYLCTREPVQSNLRKTRTWTLLRQAQILWNIQRLWKLNSA